jgi:hypothetical protein
MAPAPVGSAARKEVESTKSIRTDNTLRGMLKLSVSAVIAGHLRDCGMHAIVHFTEESLNYTEKGAIFKSLRFVGS